MNYYLITLVSLILIAMATCMRMYYISQNPKRDKVMGYGSSLALLLPVVCFIFMFTFAPTKEDVPILFPVIGGLICLYLLWDLKEEREYTKETKWMNNLLKENEAIMKRSREITEEFMKRNDNNKH